MDRVVITGVGLTSPLGNCLKEFRGNLLEAKSGIEHKDIRHIGKVPAGLCCFDETKYQKRKFLRRGTRVGSIGVFCANEALGDAGIAIDDENRDRIGIYLGITEHGNVETENEIHELYQNDLDIKLWSHHHNPRTVANNPAGEITINLKTTGPHYTIGAACAAGNLGLIQGLQMLRLKEVDYALAGGVSESPMTFGIFAAFKSQGALGQHENPELASNPLSKDRNGIAVSEGGAIFVLERLEDAIKRGSKIYGEIVGYATNSDATDFVLPNPERQSECINKALKMADIYPEDIDILNLHATGTVSGDIAEVKAVNNVFEGSDKTYVNCTKGMIGHAMGAAGALELAGNLLSFEDNYVHPCHSTLDLDPECNIKNLVSDGPEKLDKIEYILNNSFGMLGINSVLVVKRYPKN